MDTKKTLLEILKFYVTRIENDTCTMSEMESAVKALESNMEISGTMDDFAKFYGKSKSAVHGVIKRYMIPKPKRKVLYPFHIFRKIIPPKWNT